MTLNIFKPSHLITSVVLGLGISTNAFAENKVSVVTSFSILGDLVSQVGGNHIDITTLVKANGDAHVYSPTPKDALAVKNAQVLVVNGLNFEGWMPRFLESAHFTGTEIVASNGIDVINIDEDEHDADHHASNDKHEEHADKHDDDHEGHADKHDDDHEEHQHHGEHHHEGVDPHAWNSITNVKTYIKNIAKGLSKVDPENSKDYNDNATAYLQKLEKLDISLHAKMNTIPLVQRKIITPHDAFTYFARDFGVEFIAPQGTSTESEASASDMAAIIKQIRKDKITAVFMENIADNRMVEQISHETNAKMGGELFSDSLSDKQGPASTYLDMMEYNVTTIVNALTR